MNEELGQPFAHDPYSKKVENNCAKCDTYLGKFLKTQMRRCQWKPSVSLYYCTGCAETKVYPKDSDEVNLDRTKCRRCATLVIDSLADVLVFLLAAMEPISKHPQGEWLVSSETGHRELIMWMQSLFTKTFHLWKIRAIRDLSHLPELSWSKNLMSIKSYSTLHSLQIRRIKWPTDIIEEPAVEEEAEDELILTENGNQLGGAIADTEGKTNVNPNDFLSDTKQQEAPAASNSSNNNNLSSMDVEQPGAPNPTRKRKRVKPEPEPEMVMVKKSDLSELLKLPGEIKKLKQRLNVAERSLKRTHDEVTKGSQPKRLRLDSLPAKLSNLAHLKDYKFFYNWWSKGASHISPERALPELTNMGFSREALERLESRVLSELYCLVLRLLLTHRALEEMPRHVPRCYMKPGLKEEYVHEKIRNIDPGLYNTYAGSKDFFAVDRRKAGLVAKEIAARPKKTPVLGENHLRVKIGIGKTSLNERLLKTPRTVSHSSDPGIIHTRVFTNSDRRRSVGKQTSAGAPFPASSLTANKSLNPNSNTVSNDNLEDTVALADEDAVIESDGEGASEIGSEAECYDAYDNFSPSLFDEDFQGRDTEQESNGEASTDFHHVREVRTPPVLTHDQRKIPVTHQSRATVKDHASMKPRKSRSKKASQAPLRRDHSRDAKLRIPGFAGSSSRMSHSSSSRLKGRTPSPDCYGRSREWRQTRQDQQDHHHHHDDYHGPRRQDSRDGRRDGSERHQERGHHSRR